MEQKQVTLNQLIDEYKQTMDESAKFTYLVRDAELQQEQVDLLQTLKKRIKGFKCGAIQSGNEDAANILFHLQCVLNAQISYLTMWILLKKDEYRDAWDCLIDAYEYLSIALRAADGGTGLEDFLDQLKSAERVIYPGYPLYNSCGLTVRGGVCTVCRKPFEECEHIEGLVYWGRLCARAEFEVVELDHVAVVDTPRDRKCVIQEITTEDGFRRDYITWRTIGKVAKDDGAPDTPKSFTGTFFSFKGIEID